MTRRFSFFKLNHEKDIRVKFDEGGYENSAI